MSEQRAAALLDVAVAAAREAGGALLERFRASAAGVVRTKSTPTDLVSEADIEAQRLIRALIARERPGEEFVGEEEDRTQVAQGQIDAGAPQGGLRWVVDPLDGTVNFLFGIPQWCVSVAVQERSGRTLAGAIYDPCREELFTAVADGEATLGGGTLAGPPQRPLAQAMVATGFYYDARVRGAQAQTLVRLLPAVRDIRRMGSAALDLAWTAAGRYDAYFERGVKSWDIAAGELICACAGLAVHELAEQASGLLPRGILVARAELAGELQALLAER